MLHLFLGNMQVNVQLHTRLSAFMMSVKNGPYAGTILHSFPGAIYLEASPSSHSGQCRTSGEASSLSQTKLSLQPSIEKKPVGTLRMVEIFFLFALFQTSVEIRAGSCIYCVLVLSNCAYKLIVRSK